MSAMISYQPNSNYLHATTGVHCTFVILFLHFDLGDSNGPQMTPMSLSLGETNSECLRGDWCVVGVDDRDDMVEFMGSSRDL